MELFVKLLFIINVFAKSSYIFASNDPIDISNYNYPLPENPVTEPGIYRIAIMGTNDIHGSAFPLTITHPQTKEQYLYGGLEYMASYYKILKGDWGNRLLWLDGGDQFQGGIESKISNGTIMTDFFNYLMVHGSAIGNHEWDFGQPYLYDRLKDANFLYLAANIYNNKTNKTEFLPNTKVAKIFSVGDIKIGVIGLSTVETPYTTSGDLTDIKFAAYREVIIELSTMLKQQGAHSVILTAHVGMFCLKEQEERLTLKLRTNKTPQEECNQNSEIVQLINSLDEGVIDAVVGGHVHNVVHHFVKKVPVVQSINGGYYSNVIYLTFNKTSKAILRDLTVIEGPLPVCDKVFDKRKRCDFITKTDILASGDLKKYTFHKKPVDGDKSLQTIFSKWWDEVKKYKVKVCSTEGLLKKNIDEENTLGNLITDILRNKTQSDVAIINGGIFRSEWFPGDILVESLYNMFPFKNDIVSFDMTGAELKKAMFAVQGGLKGFYQTSGLQQNVTLTPKSLLNLRLFNGSDIIDNKTYKIGSIDFIIPIGGDDFRSVIDWYTPRNLKYHNVTLREEVQVQLSRLELIRENSFIDQSRPRINIVSK
jgi:2',3'-cyclic-nucleotide 2'-phosphodiesterase/3'-nucleotidase